MTKNDAPHCFGKAESCGNSPACAVCIFTDSCRFYVENPPPREDERDSTGHFVSYDHIAHDKRAALNPEDAEKVADVDYDAPYFSRADLEALLFFLLREVDDYTLSIAEEMLRGSHESAASIAKVFGVSREAMNRKIYDSCRKYPQLAVVFRGCLHKCARLARVDAIGKIDGRKNHEKKGVKNKCRQMLIPSLSQEI